MKVTASADWSKAIAAMGAAFPTDPKKQRGILNSSMRSAASEMLADAKQRAITGDASGSLSESIGIRSKSKKSLAMSMAVAGVEITPVRYNPKAIALYLRFYYAGKTAPRFGIDGIRHGHLVEFGSKNNAARPFLWPAAQSNQQAYERKFAADLTKKTEAAVKRAAAK